MDTAAELMALPPKTQDYLKVIWDVNERGEGAASLGAVAERLGEKVPTASEAIKRLGKAGLVEHPKYQGITLTPKGERLAIAMIRRHRLLEMFLVTTLGCSWDEVHDEAELLEHALSEKLLDRIDQHLGRPRKDPHGDPIPDSEGNVASIDTTRLDEAAVGSRVIVERISDHDPKLLRYLELHQVLPGSEVHVIEPPYEGVTLVQADEQAPVTIAAPQSSWIQVRVGDAE